MDTRWYEVEYAAHEPDRGVGGMLLRLLANAAGLLLASAIVPGIDIDDWQSLVVATAIFAIVSTLVKPLVTFVSCCLVVLTLGLFLVVINAAMLGATARAAGQLGLDFRVAGFWSAVGGSLVISAVSLLASLIVRRPRVTYRRR